MRASHQAFARARRRLLGAQAVFAEVAGDEVAVAQASEALTAAEAEMRAAEEENATVFERAWDLNRRAVTEADAELVAAKHYLAVVQGEVGTAARQRWARAGGVGLVVLTDEEELRVAAAREVVLSSAFTCNEARDRFKAGVTVEQLADAAG